MPAPGGAAAPPPHPSPTRGEGGARRHRRAVLLGLGLCLAAATAAAHDGVRHATPAKAAAHAAAAGAAAPTEAPALPFPADIPARFRLTDQAGSEVTQADFAGRPMAIVFGYATCEAICSVALPRLGQALDLLGPSAAALAPILITVDPARDTPEAMRASLARWHPRLIGLTGSEAALAEARAAFQVEARKVFDGPEGPVYAHGSFIYLVGPDGRVLTLLPPILGPERMAEVIAGYL
jgi:protein SCO1